MKIPVTTIFIMLFMVVSAHANFDTTSSRLTSITSSLAGQFGYTYDLLGRGSTVSYPNGIVGTYSYNADQPGWLAGINYGSAYSVSYPSFDKVGNRTAKYDGIGTSYSYDAVYRLLTSTGGESFSYDNAGNRLTEAGQLYAIGTGNQLQSAKGVTYAYDDLGNTVTAGVWAYSWNGAGKLSTAVSGTMNASYTYDPFGRRISKTVNGVSTTFLYDGQDIAASVTNGVATHFIHGSGVDEHLAMVQGGVPYFYLADGLGSVTRLTNGSQAVVGSASYTSFGTPSMSGIMPSQPYGFTGREFDPETGNHHYRARTYNSDTGRFLSRDPIGMAAGDVVLWNYVGGNPVNLTDPSGLIAPAIAVPLYYTGAKLLAVGTAWLGYKTATTSMRATGLASNKQACDAQKAGNNTMKSVLAINAVGAPLAVGPGLATYYGPSLYTTGMVWAGSGAGQGFRTGYGQDVINELPNTIEALLPGPPPMSPSGYILGSYEFLTTIFGGQNE